MDMFQMFMAQRMADEQRNQGVIFTSDESRRFGTRISPRYDLEAVYVTYQPDAVKTEKVIKADVSMEQKRESESVKFKTRVLENRNNKVTIDRPPLWWLIKFSDLLPKKYETDLKQNVSDVRIEYYEALDKGVGLKAKLIVGFYILGLTWTFARWVINSIIGGIFPIKDH